MNNALKNIGVMGCYTIIVAIITILAVLLMQNTVFAPRNTELVVTNDIVVERIEDKFFAVTQTIYSDQETRIKLDRSSDIDEFFRGKEVVAEGRVRVDLGVDFSELQSEDIVVDNTNKVITIKNSGVSVLDSSIMGDIEVEVEGSIFTRIFDNTSNKDYQEAISKLTEAGERAATSNQEIIQQSETNAEKFLSYLFSDTGYTVQLEQEETAAE